MNQTNMNHQAHQGHQENPGDKAGRFSDVLALLGGLGVLGGSHFVVVA
jgi:hypothetical protein